MLRFLILFCSAAAACAAALDCSLTPQEALVGEALTFNIKVAAASGTPVKVLWPENGDFQLLSMDSAAYAQSGTFSFLVAVYDTGSYELAGIPVVVAAETLRTQPVRVRIQPSLPDSATSVKANKGYREQRFRLRELLGYWWLAALLVLAGISWWIWHKFFRKVPQDSVFKEPELPPAEQAMRDLILLRDQRFPQRGMLKEFYSDYSHIMRNYLERRYVFPALEMTTFDLEDELRDTRYLADLRARLLPALRQADLVKFAKYLPSAADCEQLIELGFELVTKTKPADLPEAEKKEQSQEAAA